MKELFKSTDWVPKVYDATGTWSIEEDDGRYKFVLGADFKTGYGPDVKVYLTKVKLEDIQNRDPVNEQGIFLGALQSFSGAQEYDLPADINLAEYNSIVIHCKRFSVVWNGVDLNQLN